MVVDEAGLKNEDDLDASCTVYRCEVKYWRIILSLKSWEAARGLQAERRFPK